MTQKRRLDRIESEMVNGCQECQGESERIEVEPPVRIGDPRPAWRPKSYRCSRCGRRWVDELIVVPAPGEEKR